MYIEVVEVYKNRKYLSEVNKKKPVTTQRPISYSQVCWLVGSERIYPSKYANTMQTIPEHEILIVDNKVLNIIF